MKSHDGVEVYENLLEITAPQHSCLVVWDVQNGLVDRCFNRVELLANLRKLLGALRGRMPVFYTLITPPPRGFRSSWGVYSMMRRFRVDDPGKIPEFMAPGSHEREIPAEVAPEPGDLVLEKPTANIFLGTPFEAMIRPRGIQTILFTGIATEVGVETSARDAGARGFYPVIVTDCVSASDREAHERSVAGMRRSFIAAASDEVIGCME